MVIQNETEMKKFGEQIGTVLRGGEVIELIGDVGAGKTTLTKGVALGLDISEPVQSPTFTISRVYEARDDLALYHYDFYRLGEAGIMAEDIGESINQPGAITIVEWSGAVSDVLPADRLQIHIKATSDDEREVELTSSGDKSQKLREDIA